MREYHPHHLPSEAYADLAYSHLRREVRRFIPDRIPSLPIVIQAHELCDSFRLPRSILMPMVDHLLTSEPIPDDAFTTTLVEDWGLIKRTEGMTASDLEEAIELECYQMLTAGLPDDITGNLVIVKLVVNANTIKKDIEAAWTQIKQIQKERYGRTRNYRPNVEKYKKWIPAYLAHVVGGLTLDQVSTDYCVDNLETLEYQIEQLDEVLDRPEKSRS